MSGAPMSASRKFGLNGSQQDLVFDTLKVKE